MRGHEHCQHNCDAARIRRSGRRGLSRELTDSDRAVLASSSAASSFGASAGVDAPTDRMPADVVVLCTGPMAVMELSVVVRGHASAFSNLPGWQRRRLLRLACRRGWLAAALRDCGHL